MNYSVQFNSIRFYLEYESTDVQKYIEILRGFPREPLAIGFAVKPIFQHLWKHVLCYVIVAPLHNVMNIDESVMWRWRIKFEDKIWLRRFTIILTAFCVGKYVLKYSFCRSLWDMNDANPRFSTNNSVKDSFKTSSF